MCGACDTYGREKECKQLPGKQDAKICLGVLRVGRGIMIKYDLNKLAGRRLNLSSSG
jgi:hypothetical protein